MKKQYLVITAAFLFSFSSFAGDSASKDADNSGKNERDRNGAMKTPLDQSNDPADIKITADIRKTLMDDKSLTMTAKNVKIITIAGGHVILRGPVTSSEEKTKIVEAAKTVAGPDKVEDRLEIKSN